MVKLKIFDTGKIGFTYPSISEPVIVNGKSSWDSFEDFYDDYSASKTPTLPQFYRFEKAFKKGRVDIPEVEPRITIPQAIKILEDHNQWRRGDESKEMIEPKKIGQAIELAIFALQCGQERNWSPDKL